MAYGDYSAPAYRSHELTHAHGPQRSRSPYERAPSPYDARVPHQRSLSGGEVSIMSSVAPGDSASQIGADSYRPQSRYAQADYLSHDPNAAACAPSQVSGSAYSQASRQPIRFVGDGAREYATSYSAPSAHRQPYGSDFAASSMHQLDYSSHPDDDVTPLVKNAADPAMLSREHSGYADPYAISEERKGGLYDDPHAIDALKERRDLEAYPPSGSPAPALDEKRPSVWKRIIRDPSPLEQRIDNHRRGIGVQARPWATWVFSVAMIGAFIFELVVSAQNNGGNPFSFKPFVNPMLGPSSGVLINVGARFRPCMTSVPSLDGQLWACPNNTANPATSICTLEELCGFGGFGPSQQPDQTFRFITPVFLHAGLIHIALNLVVQLTSSAQVEREMGSPRYIVVYIAAGIFGFILGGNFGLVAQPSVGASGAIFGTHAAVLVDLLAHWDIEQSPRKKLAYLLVEIVVGIGLGYVPGVDNFAHLGGMAMGLLLAVWLYPAIHQTRRHRIVFYVLRAIAVPVVVLAFVLSIRNFYTVDPSAACGWCRYLSCIPTASNGYCKGTGLAQSTV